MALLSRTVFLQNNLWGGSSPACNCRQPPCPGKGSPNPLQHASALCSPQVSEGWEHLSSSGLVPGEAPPVVPYQPSPKQVMTGASGIWLNKPFSAPATVVGIQGPPAEERKLKSENGEEREGRGARAWQQPPHPLGGSTHVENRGMLTASAAIPFSLPICRVWGKKTSPAKTRGMRMPGERYSLPSQSPKRDGWHRPIF